MPKENRISLGLTKRENTVSIEKLDSVFKMLSQALARNMKLAWLTRGKGVGELYRRKLEMSWEQVNRLGWRLTCLGAHPSLAGLVETKSTNNLQRMIKEDIQQEGVICTEIRSTLGTLRTGSDWSSTILLGEILAQREDAVHQLEPYLDEPVLEYIWEDEEMQMHEDKSNSVH